MANDTVRFVRTKSGAEMFVFESVKAISNYVDPQQYKFRGKDFTFGEANKGSDMEKWEDVQERLNKEWAEGIYTFNQYVERLKEANLPELKDKKRKTRFDETAGDDVDLERLRQGEAFWRTTRREDSMGQTTMTVVIDTTTPFYMNSDDILWRGAVAIAIAKLLEEKGWSAEIWVVNGSKLYYAEDTSVYTACCLKRTSDPLDVSTLINTVSGWFYRTATFTLLSSICQNRGKKLASGFGTCATPSEEDLDNLSIDEYRLYSCGVYSFEDALDMVNRQLEKMRLEQSQ